MVEEPTCGDIQAHNLTRPLTWTELPWTSVSTLIVKRGPGGGVWRAHGKSPALSKGPCWPQTPRKQNAPGKGRVAEPTGHWLRAQDYPAQSSGSELQIPRGSLKLSVPEGTQLRGYLGLEVLWKCLSSESRFWALGAGVTVGTQPLSPPRVPGSNRLGEALDTRDSGARDQEDG